MFVRKKCRGKDLGLMMLEDFVESFTEATLGLRYPLSSFMSKGKSFDLLFWSSLCFLHITWLHSSCVFMATCSVCVECSALHWRLKILICKKLQSIFWLEFNPLCEVKLLDFCWLYATAMQITAVFLPQWAKLFWVWSSYMYLLCTIFFYLKVSQGHLIHSFSDCPVRWAY